MNTNDSAPKKQTSTTVIPAKAGIHLFGNDNRLVEKAPPRRVSGGDEGKVFILEGFDDPLPEFDI